MRIITPKDGFVRTRGETTSILDYNFKTSEYDIVVSSINGSHGPMRNTKTTRTYYVISGEGAFEKEGNKYKVSTGDIIMVEPGEWTTIYGNNLKTLIICNPPFSPDDYEEAETEFAEN